MGNLNVNYDKFWSLGQASVADKPTVDGLLVQYVSKRNLKFAPVIVGASVGAGAGVDGWASACC